MGVQEKIQALYGKESPPIVGVDAVSKEMIRHWCEAMEDDNPLYQDEKYAKKTKYKGIISPPMMVQAWSFGPLWPDGQEMEWRHPELPWEKDKMPHRVGVKLLENSGFPAVIATNTTLEFFNPLFPGDQVTQKITVTDITPEKKTGQGAGHFYTFRFSYYNQKGKLICHQSFTTLYYNPPKVEWFTSTFKFKPLEEKR